MGGKSHAGTYVTTSLVAEEKKCFFIKAVGNYTEQQKNDGLNHDGHRPLKNTTNRSSRIEQGKYLPRRRRSIRRSKKNHYPLDIVV